MIQILIGIVSIIVTLISILVTIVSIVQTVKKDNHQKSDRQAKG